MTPFFSIVVPCCDVEPFLRRCLDSVENQDFSDWELLAVVEESQDGTERAVREAAARDQRIRVLAGLPRSGSCSVPRNLGVDAACGRFVVFLDGDDTLAPGALARVATGIRANPDADLYPCSIRVLDEFPGGNPPHTVDNFPPDVTRPLTGPEATLLSGTDRCPPRANLQMTVFRREFLAECGLRNIPGLRNQDLEFTPRALYLARKVVPLHELLYEYRRRKGSVQRNRRTPWEFLTDYATVFCSLFAFHAKVSSSPGFDVRISRRWSRQWLSFVFFQWFSPARISVIPRRERQATAARLLADGFRDFDTLLRHSSVFRRMAAHFVRLFVRHPRLARISDTFFSQIYYPLCSVRDRLARQGIGFDSLRRRPCCSLKNLGDSQR